MASWGHSASVQLEPLLPLPHELGVGRAIDKGVEGLRTPPDGDVDQHPVVIEAANGGGVAVFRLESPHESRRRFREGVDFIEAFDETRELGRVQGRRGAAGVEPGVLEGWRGIRLERWLLLGIMLPKHGHLPAGTAPLTAPA